MDNSYSNDTNWMNPSIAEQGGVIVGSDAGNVIPINGQSASNLAAQGFVQQPDGTMVRIPASGPFGLPPTIFGLPTKTVLIGLAAYLFLRRG